MKIKVVNGCVVVSGENQLPGSVIELEDDEASALIESGTAEAVKEEAKPAPVKSEPVEIEDHEPVKPVAKTTKKGK